MKLTRPEKALLAVGLLAALAAPLLLLLPAFTPVPPAVRAPRPLPEVVLTVSTEYDVYVVGEPVRIILWVRNVGDWATPLQLTSACTVSFVVVDERGSTVFDDAAKRSCTTDPANPSTVVLSPGGALRFDLSWDQTSGSTGQQVPAERYYSIRGILLSPTPAGGSAAQRWIRLIPGEGPPLLALAARTDRTAYRTGDTAIVTMTLTNVGKSVVSMTFPTPCFTNHFGFVVLNETRQSVYNSSKWLGGVCVQIIGRVVLAPGESWSGSFSWGLVADEGLPLPAGHTYRILPSFQWWYASSYQTYVAYTETATITIVGGGIGEAG